MVIIFWRFTLQSLLMFQALILNECGIMIFSVIIGITWNVLVLISSMDAGYLWLVVLGLQSFLLHGKVGDMLNFTR